MLAHALRARLQRILARLQNVMQKAVGVDRQATLFSAEHPGQRVGEVFSIALSDVPAKDKIRRE